jgi:hypothetical protein
MAAIIPFLIFGAFGLIAASVNKQGPAGGGQGGGGGGGTITFTYSNVTETGFRVSISQQPGENQTVYLYFKPGDQQDYSDPSTSSFYQTDFYDFSGLQCNTVYNAKIVVTTDGVTTEQELTVPTSACTNQIPE